MLAILVLHYVETRINATQLGRCSGAATVATVGIPSTPKLPVQTLKENEDPAREMARSHPRYSHGSYLVLHLIMGKSKYRGDTSHGNLGRSGFTRDTSSWDALAEETHSSWWDVEPK